MNIERDFVSDIARGVIKDLESYEGEIFFNDEDHEFTEEEHESSVNEIIDSYLDYYMGEYRQELKKKIRRRFDREYWNS